VYNPLPSPEHCGLPEDVDPEPRCGCDSLTCMGNCGE